MHTRTHTQIMHSHLPFSQSLDPALSSLTVGVCIFPNLFDLKPDYHTYQSPFKASLFYFTAIFAKPSSCYFLGNTK